MRELWGWKMIIEDWGLRVEHWGLRINDRGLIINSGGWGWWMEGRGLRIEYWGLKIEDGGLRIEDWGSRIEDRGLRIKDWGSRIEDRGLIIICRESRYFEDILKWSIFRLRTFYIFFQVCLFTPLICLSCPQFRSPSPLVWQQQNLGCFFKASLRAPGSVMLRFAPD